jgi:hypothetical protein
VLTISPFDEPIRPGSCGKILPFVEMCVFDANAEGVGELAAKGDNIMKGYYNNPAATEDVFRDGWFLTGDLGYIDADNYVFITGRKKALIVNREGKNIYPEEVELQINQSPLILESVVLGYRPPARPSANRSAPSSSPTKKASPPSKPPKSASSARKGDRGPPPRRGQEAGRRPRRLQAPPPHPDPLGGVQQDLHRQDQALPLRHERKFKELLQSIQTGLSGWSRSAPSPVRELRGPANTRVFARAWVRAPHQAMLQWSVGAGGVPEFIRLRLSPSGAGASSGAAAAAAAIHGTAATARSPILNSAALRARVQRNAAGDQLLPDVPMVDQGQKGYCAAAVTERVLRYYGRDFDQHQVAQMAGTTAEGGSSIEGLVAAVGRIARGLDLNFRKLIDMDVQKYLRLIEDYNRAARKNGLPPFQYGQMIDIDLMYRSMDPAVLRDVRTARSVDMRQYFSTVQKNIEMGVPLLWGVVLGVVPETPELPQSFGGHLRLIIGCNPRTQEVLYSDTWGSGHALKRMPLADAWTITTGLHTMLPRNVR